MTGGLDRRGALVAIAALVAACRSSGSASGTPRVVSIAPSTTEALFAIGAGPLVVGRSRFCDYPKEALALPAVGGFADPSLEAIVALRPTLVVGARGPSGPGIERALRDHGIDTFFPATESIEAIGAMITALGARVGRAEPAARVVAQVYRRVAEIGAAVEGRPHVRAVMLFDLDALVAAGPGGFPDELLRRAGADNLVTRGGAYPTLDVEKLLALDPDVLVDAASDAHGGKASLELLRARAGIRDLRAVKEGRVRALRGSAALRPGPRIGEGLASLAVALHGPGLPIAPSALEAAP